MKENDSMNRTDALKKLMKKQTQAIAARWQYRITGKLTHPASETEPWTAGIMTMTREHRSTGAVRLVAAEHYTDSPTDRRATVARADELTTRWTAFDSFADLLRGSHAGPSCGYRPSLSKSHRETIELADLYDAAQVECGDPRRAYRT
jgi:hypothetical protein